MEKILILSYYFPPCNLTASQRVGSWAKYLPENGFYPIVVTRNWSGNELTEVQRLEDSGESVLHERKDNSEVFYMPYKSTFRDQCFEKGQTNFFYKLISKVLTSIYLIGQNFSLKFIPFNNLYHQSRIILKTNPDIKYLIISGNPFEQFYFGYLLKKEFPNLKFIADYRDEWTTSELINFSPMKNFLWRIQMFSEKKWIKKADLICANTEYATYKLGKFHNRKVEVLLNGYEIPENIGNFKKIDPKKITILHNGTLYPTQNLNILVEALKIIEIPKDFILELSFPGVKINPKVAKEIEQKLNLPNIKLTLSNRIPQKELFEQQLAADIMLMVAHENIKGIVGSKLYEYIGLKKPILLCPTDEDEMERTIINTGLGIVIRNALDLKINLEKLIRMKIESGKIEMNINPIEIERYSRKAQVKQLSKYLTL